MARLQAGTSAVSLPVALGEPMMGYGLRQGVAEAFYDELHARALYLRGAEDCLVVTLDVCLIASAQAEQVRTALALETGVPRERILVSCIHTHSGPDTGIVALAAGKPTPERAAALLEAAVSAGCEAFESAQPASLGLAHAEAGIGRNRRVAEGPLDRDVLVLRVDDARGAPLAVAYVHGCHPTALGPENLAYSADWPGAAASRIREAFPGANPIFLLGAHADVDPRTRAVKDLAESGKTSGVGFDETDRLGREVGDAVARAASGIRTEPVAPVAARSSRVTLHAHAEREDERRAALAALELPADSRPGTDAWFQHERERTQGLAPDDRRERIACVRRYLRGRLAKRFAGGEKAEVEVQALRLGDAHFAALPLEATVDVGRDWKARAASPHAAVLSIANGWLRYLPHTRNFQEPGAHTHYEVLMSTFEPEAATQLLDLAERLDGELSAELGG
jgi:hypothetical protein